MSGKDDKLEQPILVTLLVFQLEISGNDVNELHAQKHITHISNIISIPIRNIR